MKLFGFFLLLSFFVCSFAAPLAEQNVEESSIALTEDEIQPNFDWWQKILDMVAKVKGVIKESTMKVLLKHKKEILDAIMHLKNVIIACGKDLVIEIKNGIIKIITNNDVIMADISNPNDQAIALTKAEIQTNFDWWQKLLDMVAKVKGVIKESTMKVLLKHKKEILDAIMHLKNVIIACGKDLVIEIKNGIIKIIVDGMVQVSDGSNPNEFLFEGDYVMIKYSDDDAGLQGIKDMWGKVTDAFKNLKEKIAEKSGDLFDKLSPIVDRVLAKYKAQIVQALEKGGEVIIQEGKKIAISVVNDVVKVIIDGIEAFSKKLDVN